MASDSRALSKGRWTCNLINVTRCYGVVMDVCMSEGTEGTPKRGRCSQAEQPIGIKQPWLKEFGAVRKIKGDQLAN